MTESICSLQSLKYLLSALYSKGLLTPGLDDKVTQWASNSGPPTPKSASSTLKTSCILDARHCIESLDTMPHLILRLSDINYVY